MTTGVIDVLEAVKIDVTQHVCAIATLRNDPEAIRLLRLRVADVGTSLFNLTIYYADMRNALRAVAKATP